MKKKPPKVFVQGTMATIIACLVAASVHAHADEGGHAAGAAHAHAADIGMPGNKAKATRTVRVDMTDAMRFVPASVAVKQGETVRFVVKNSGQLKHEFVLGTDKDLAAHAEMMKKFPDMQHSDPNMVTLAAGESGEVVWRFTKAGPVEFACLQPGHFDAGMRGAVNVSAGGKGAAR